MRIVAIVQARMTSSRLPGKVLATLGSRPLLAQLLRRLRESRRLSDIVVATSINSSDDPLIDLARQESCSWYRGSEGDVLARFSGAAQTARADVIVRITSDCPLIDGGVVDQVVDGLLETGTPWDYASNVIERTYPRGLDAEAFHWDTLARMNRLGRSRSAREHVTVAARSEHPELFLMRSVPDIQDNSDLRWTVDTAQDLEVVRLIYQRLGLDTAPRPYREILAQVRGDPALMARDTGGQTWDPTHQPI